MKLTRPLLATDSEGTGVFPFLGDRPFAISTARAFGDDVKTAFWRVPVDPFTRAVDWRGRSGPWEEFASSKVVKVLHNAKYDCRMYEMIGHPLVGRIEDTMIMARVLFSDEDVGLKPLGEKWLEVSTDDEQDLAAATQKARDEAKKKGWKIADDSGRFGNSEPWRADYWLAPAALLERYARLDAERTLLLFHLLNPMLDEDPRLRQRYEEEMELFRVVYDMEGRGIRCSRRVCQFENRKSVIKQEAHHNKLRAELKKIGFKTEQQVPYVGTQKRRKWMKVEVHDINVKSGPQKEALVYKHLKFPIKHFTDKGNPATSSDALREMEHPAIDELIRVQAQIDTRKFFNNYLLHSQWSGKDGCDILHPDFYQVGARTGRFSCRNPNLQNVPDAFNTRGFEPIQARMPFGPRPGKIWLHGDWSQIEMWIFAGEADDKALLEDLHTGNLHTATANRVFGRGRDIVSEEAKLGKKNARGRAKMLNFGVVFCMGVDSMANALKCSRTEAKEHLDYYYEHYHRIRPFMEDIMSTAGREGCIWNRYGWRLQVARHAPYRAVNYIVQSSAAAHMKEKMRWLDGYYRAHPEIGASIVLTIHDEIVTEVEEAKILPHIKTIRSEFENHHGRWSNFPKLPLEFKVTRRRWDKPDKLEVK